jgi:hypothetical protein
VGVLVGAVMALVGRVLAQLAIMGAGEYGR